MKPRKGVTNLLDVSFFLTGRKKITTRTVYNFSQLLGDAGGLYSALLWIGSVVNFFFQGLDSGIALLQHFYKIET